MKTILVLTDFSSASYHAASYACLLAKQLKISNIVLYHSYQPVIAPGETNVNTGDSESMEKEAMQALTEQTNSLQGQLPVDITINYRTDTNLLNEISIVAIEESAIMIVMGTTGKSKLEEMVAGSSAMLVCKNSYLPVVLVPDGIALEPINNILLAGDMKETDETLPTEQLTNLLELFNVPVSVLHVEKEEGDFSPSGVPEALRLNKLLQPFNPTYQSIKNDDTARGILDAAKQQPATAVLVIAKHYGFLSGLFHQSITKQLASNTTVPLIVLQTKEAEPFPEIPLLEI